MSRTIDQRIVELKFDNKEFERNTRESMTTLDLLKKALNFDKLPVGNLANIGKNMGLDEAQAGVETLADKFSALDVVAFTVLQRLTNAAIDLGTKLVGAIADPLVQGGKKRALNFEAAEFQMRGLFNDDLSKVKEMMDAADYAVTGTAYGLDAAAVAASQLAASMDEEGLKKMPQHLRSIAGVAAMTNSSYEDMSRIFATVSGNGRLMSMQLLQLGSKGLNAAAVLAKHFGVTEAELRDMVSKGKISFEMFSDAMYEAFGEHAAKANDTFTGATGNLRAAFARIGVKFWQPVLESIRQFAVALKPVVDVINKALDPAIKLITGTIQKFADFVNFKFLIPLGDSFKVVDEYGQTIYKSFPKNDLMRIVGAIGQVFENLFGWVKPIADALKEVLFPGLDDPIKMWKDFAKVGPSLEKFAESMKISETTADNLKRTFKGLFNVVGLLVDIFKAIVGVGFEVVKMFFPAMDAGLGFTAILGDMVTDLRATIKEGKLFGGILQSLKDLFGPMADALGSFADKVKEFFGSIRKNKGEVDEFGKEVERGFRPFETLGKILGKAVELLLGLFEKAMPFIRTSMEWLSEKFKEATTNAKEFMSTLDLGNLMKGFALGGIGLFFTNLNTNLNNIGAEFGHMFTMAKTPIFRFNAMLFDLKQTLITYQTQLKAGVILKIATAIAILAAGLWLLSTIKPEALATGISAMTGLFFELVGTMIIFEKTMGKGSALKLAVIGASLIALASAIAILSLAVRSLAKVDPDRLHSSVLALGAILAMTTVAAKVLSSSQGKLIKGATGLIALALAINILASAVKKLAVLNWEELAVGLTGVGIILAELSIFLSKTDFKGFGPGKALGLVLLAAAVSMLAKSVASFKDISVGELAKGLSAVGVILAELALFLKFTKDAKGVILTATGLVILAAAMKIFVGVVNDLGSMKLGELSQGLIGLGVALGLIAASTRFMPKNMISIGIGVGILAVSLTILIKVIKQLGTMPLGEIVIGLVALAGVFGVLALGAYLLQPVAPTLLLVAAAATLFGLAMIGTGVGLMSFATGLTMLAGAGAAGVAALGALVLGLAALIPEIAIMLARGVVKFAETIREGIPVIVDVIKAFVGQLMVTVIELTPKMVKTVLFFLLEIMAQLKDAVPQFTRLGLDIIIGFLEGLNEKLPELVKVGIDLILNFIRGINFKMEEIIDTAFKTIISFINGLAEAIRNNGKELREAGINLVMAIIEGVLGVFKDLAKLGKDIISEVLKGVADAWQWVWDKGKEVGGNLIDGVKKGVTDKAKGLAKAATDAVSSAVNGVKNFLGIKSPSRLFMEIGENTMLGMTKGVLAMGSSVEDASESVGDKAMAAMRDAMNEVDQLLDEDLDSNPVIRPIIDLESVKDGIRFIGEMFTGSNLEPAFATGAVNAIANRTSKKQQNVESVQNGSNTVYNVSVGGTYHVRDETDIRKISEELAKEIERRRRD